MGTWARNNSWKHIKIGPEADDILVEPPSGKITITENGTDIDVSTYATADVAVSGGSSDFSTAEVTLVLTPPEGVTLTSWVIVNASFNTGNISWLPNDNLIEETNKIILPMAKNADNSICAVFEDFSGVDAEYNEYGQSPDNVLLSGNIEYNSDLNMYVVTGDCTITANVLSAST